MRFAVHSVIFLTVLPLLLLSGMAPVWGGKTSSATVSCADGTLKPTADIDLRAGFPPVSDQDGSGWCYAYGSAAQMSYWAIRHHVSGMSLDHKNYVSAAASALSYNREERNEEYGRTAARLVMKRASEPRIQELKAQKDQLQAALQARSTYFEQSDPLLQQAKKGKADTASWGYHSPSFTSPPKFALMETSEEKRLKELLASDPETKALQKQLDRVKAELETFQISIGDSVFKEPGGGTPEKVLERMADEGLCLESQVSSVDDGPAEELQSKWLTQVFDQSYSGYLENPSPSTACDASMALHQIFTGIQVPEIREILKNSNEEDPLEKLWQRSCQGHLVKLGQKPLIQSIPRSDLPREFQAVLDQKIPVGLSYHSEVFDVGPDIYDKSVEKKEQHYSVLVGKTYDCAKKKTVYILRNSWGKDTCASRRSSFRRYSQQEGPPQYVAASAKISATHQDCLKKCPSINMASRVDSAEQKIALKCIDTCNQTEGEANIGLNQPPYECDGGDYLITEDQLMLGTLNATYLK